MKRNFSSLNFGSRNLIPGNFETTYKSTYGNFYPEFSISKNNFNSNNNQINGNQKYCTNKTINSKHPHLILNQTNLKIPNSRLICPNCINENIVNMKSRSRIKRAKKESEIFEDKMKTIHENKKKADIKKREERSKQTYYSLFDNRGRSQEVYKNIPKANDGSVNREGEYFGKDIEYGMMRCRNRELQNDKTLFGIDLDTNNESRKNRKLTRNNNKSWYGKNYVLDKSEYCQIINTQIEKNNKKSQKEKNRKLREENKLLTEQLNDEKNKIKIEINNKNNIRDEMNRINSYLLKEKKDRENTQKNYKKKEKENISNFCKKEIEDFVKNLKMKKIQNQIVVEDNYRYTQIKNNENEKAKNLRSIYSGLSFKGVENNKCDQCNRPYPKNVLSQLYYTYDVQQKK